jgi:hypothetical protein
VKRCPFLFAVATLSGLAVAPLSATPAQAACAGHHAAADSSLVDTLPRFDNITAATRDTSAHIRAATDALVGRSSVPPPLLLASYRREGTTVLVDLRADSIPTLRWRNGGGTVRIRADGCRIIVARHNQ